ncbi:MAG: hypothetical protein J6U54_24980 [Clostridiales bacterium]|nr:hypothetical protein [Clostridiales bacterium]
MPDSYNSKVVLSTGEVLIDLTPDTVTAAALLSGYTAHGADGAPVVGSCTYDADTSDANALAAEILDTKTAYVNGVKVTGSMTNRGGVTGVISTVAGSYTIPQGYHDGSGTASIDSTEQSKITPGNIKAGVEILGVTGTYTGEAISVTTATATPTFSAQTILPGTGYDYLSQVTVNAIPVTRVLNAAGGYTVTIG